jgi:4-amino-4-deoxy-L-arabinose transferase-like glycosyltransferase
MMASKDMNHQALADRPAACVLILFLLSAAIMGFNLGTNSLHNDDEAKHAIVAREAAARGSWLPLTFEGKPYYSKPPLRIWLTALNFELAGVNAWAVRLWSGIFGIATVLVLYLVGRHLWSGRIALFSALILLTSHQYLYNHCVRTGETDAMLIFCWTSGLLLLQLSIRQESRTLLFLSAGFLGLCGMVKHLGFVPIVLSIAIGYVWLAGVWRTFSLRTWLTSLGVLAVVVLPWHILMWIRPGKVFIEVYLFGEVVEKRLQVGPESQTWNSAEQYISLVTLVHGFFPWSYLLPFGLADLVRSRAFRRDWLLPTLWLVVAMMTTVVSGRKYSWYVLPAFPAAAILVARFLDRFLGESRDRLVGGAVLLGGLAALLSVSNAAEHNPFAALARREMLSVEFLGRLRGPETTPFFALALLILIGAVVGLGWVLLGRLDKARALRAMFRWIFVSSIFALAAYTVVVPLRFSRHRSAIDQMASAAAPYLERGETLLVALPLRETRNSRFRFYFGNGNVRRIENEELESEALSGGLVLTNLEGLERIAGDEDLQVLTQVDDQLLLRLSDL